LLPLRGRRARELVEAVEEPAVLGWGESARLELARAPVEDPAVGEQEADRVALVPAAEDPAVGEQETDRVALVPAAEDSAGGDQEADWDRVVLAPAVGDPGAERQGWARGLELEAAAVRRSFPEWWPVLRAVGLEVEASRRKRNSSGFLVR
jgi:hypothetical protein